MTRSSHVLWLGLAFLALGACGGAPAPGPSQPAGSAAPHDTLRRIVERYWDEQVPRGQPLSPQFMADSLSLERRYLAEVLAVPRAPLDADSKLTYDIFRRQRELDIEALTYPAELMPVNPFDGMPVQLARAAAQTEQRPLAAPKDFENWQLRIDEYVRWQTQAIANMHEGMRRGYTSPRVVMVRTLPLLQSLGEDVPGNVFYALVRTMPQSIGEPERARLTSSLTSAVKDRLLPAYRELHDFIQNEYLPRARPSLALSALPLGASWYANRVKRAAGTQLTPNEIHAIGVAEVQRIQSRLKSLPPAAPAVAAPGASPAAPGSGGAGAQGGAGVGADELLNAYQEFKVQTLAAMPSLFSAVPPADFEIRALVPMSAAARVLAYQRASPGAGTPAVLYIDTTASSARSAKVETAGFLQEAIPGRHYQSALQQERTDLPRFRRFGSEPAFVDGWALYAASLGEELGLYRDDEARRGELLGQLRCAVALVVDTGLHAKGWTRDQAVAYLQAQMAADEAEANLWVDRFVALPGDALACKIGELKIRALRSRAAEALGARFDVREFHSQILDDGAMPLDILEAKVLFWMEARR